MRRLMNAEDTDFLIVVKADGSRHYQAMDVVEIAHAGAEDPKPTLHQR